MIEPNIPLLRKTMEYIEAHPEEWNQNQWSRIDSCRSTMCFAGTAAMLSGATFAHHQTISHVKMAHYCQPPGERGFRSIESYAIDELGLTWDQAGRIFYCYTEDPGRLREVVEAVIGEKL